MFVLSNQQHPIAVTLSGELVIITIYKGNAHISISTSDNLIASGRTGVAREIFEHFYSPPLQFYCSPTRLKHSYSDKDDCQT